MCRKLYVALRPVRNAVAVSCLIASVLHAADLESSPEWPSPDHRFLIRHIPSVNLASIDTIGELAVYLLQSDRTVLWTATSTVDESAHEFRAVWSEDSRAALILDRPNRGLVQLCVLRVAPKLESFVLAMDTELESTLKASGDSREMVSEKEWFGECEFSEGVFRGVALVAKTKYHRILFSIDPSASKPKLSILQVQTFDKWEDALQKLSSQR